MTDQHDEPESDARRLQKLQQATHEAFAALDRGEFSTFDVLTCAELVESLAMIDQGMEDVKAGRVRDFREGIQSIANELGLKLKE